MAGGVRRRRYRAGETPEDRSNSLPSTLNLRGQLPRVKAESWELLVYRTLLNPVLPMATTPGASGRGDPLEV